MAHESTFTRAIAPHARSALSYSTRAGMTGNLIDDITFPIDVVYTWVDGADPAWRARRDAALSVVAEPLPPRAANESRYVSRDELRYSFRSVHSFAPWVRHIWLVVDDQIPSWLDPDHEQVSVVTHKELFGNTGKLPTFNSHAIESRLHHIEGLSEHFLYFNDDVFLGRLLPPQAFFEANGLSRIYLSTVKIDSGPVDIADVPSTMAAKNNRRLIMERFDRRVTFKMKHAPMALRRSVLAEIEEQYPDELAATACHQFRHPDDVSLTSSLHQYYSFLSGWATIGELAYMYLNISAPETPAVLRLALMSRRFDVFCINDTESDAITFPKQHVLMQDFLDAYFPVAAPWEKQGEVGRGGLG
jgi:hypothetical protein